MRKTFAILLLAALIVTLAGCGRGEPVPDTPNVLVPSVMYEGEIYLVTGEKPAGEVTADAIVGRISSTVPLSQWPAEEGQANFDALDAPYAVTADGLVVLWNNEWTLFERPEAGSAE